MEQYEEELLKKIAREWELIKKEKKMAKSYFQNHKNTLVYFGAGNLGYIEYKELKKLGIYPDYFCDNNPTNWGRRIIAGQSCIPCISPEELYELKDADVFITLTKADEVYEQLKDKIKRILKYPILYLGDNYNIFYYEKEKIIEIIKNLYSILTDELSKKVVFYKLYSYLSSFHEINNIEFSSVYSKEWYVPKDIVGNLKDSFIVDCGAYTGDTLDDFINKWKIEFKEYYAYEMNCASFEKLKENRNSYKKLKERIHIFPYGLGEKNERKRYLSEMDKGSVLDNSGDKYAKIVTLDKHLKKNKISYIKMDIEGAEQEAILGAKEHISKYRPKCAISCYHKVSDIWEIPFLLKKFIPDYQIYMRHHALTYCETVCYAK